MVFNKKPHFVFYGNSSSSIGAGHVMRLYALAEWVKKIDCNITFIYKECLSNQLKKINQAHFNTKQLASPLNCEQIMQLAATHIIIDDYLLSEEEWSMLEQLPVNTIAFDDNVSTKSLWVDLIINSSANTSIESYKQRAPKAILCLGIQYTLLRQEFVQQQTGMSEFNKKNKILITMGGTDVLRLTLPLCQELLYHYPELNLEVLSGNTTDLHKIQELAQQYPQLNLHVNSNQVAELMADAGMAISAAGSTLNELASMKIPTIALVCAENQAVVLNSKFNGQWYEAYDLRLYQQESAVLAHKTIHELGVAAHKLFVNYPQRLKMHQLTKKAVNINGGQLIVERIMELSPRT